MGDLVGCVGAHAFEELLVWTVAVLSLFGSYFGILLRLLLAFIFVFVLSDGFDDHLWSMIFFRLAVSCNLLLRVFVSFLSCCGVVFFLSLL